MIGFRERAAGTLLAAVAALHPAALAAERALYTVAPGASRATFYAHATGHDFSGTTTDARGHARFEPGALAGSVDGEVRVGVAWIDTGIARRNAEMRRLLEAEKHPDIVFVLEKIVAEGEAEGPLPAKCALHGSLRVRGVKHPLAVPVAVEPADGAFVVRGEFPLDIRELGIDPPRAMLFIRMQPLVRVELELRFQIAP